MYRTKELSYNTNFQFGKLIMWRVLVFSLLSMLISACDVGDSMREASKNNPVTNARVIAADNECLSCHAVGVTVVGPAWKLVAKKYKDQPGAKEFLIEKIKSGGKGNWNTVTGNQSMPGYQDRLTEQEIVVLVDYILSL